MACRYRRRWSACGCSTVSNSAALCSYTRASCRREPDGSGKVEPEPFDGTRRIAAHDREPAARVEEQAVLTRVEVRICRPSLAFADPDVARSSACARQRGSRPSRSAGRTFRWTLPKRLKSITSHAILPGSISGSATEMTASVLGSSSVPSFSMAIPDASRAVAGQRVSGARNDSHGVGESRRET